MDNQRGAYGQLQNKPASVVTLVKACESEIDEHGKWDFGIQKNSSIKRGAALNWDCYAVGHDYHSGKELVVILNRTRSNVDTNRRGDGAQSQDTTQEQRTAASPRRIEMATNFINAVAERLKAGDQIAERDGYLLTVLAVKTVRRKTTLTLKAEMTPAFEQTVNARSYCKRLDTYVDQMIRARQDDPSTRQMWSAPCPADRAMRQYDRNAAERAAEYEQAEAESQTRAEQEAGAYAEWEQAQNDEAQQ